MRVALQLMAHARGRGGKQKGEVLSWGKGGGDGRGRQEDMKGERMGELQGRSIQGTDYDCNWGWASLCTRA